MAIRGGITLKDVYDVVNRLEEKMDLKFEDHEQRIRQTETFQNKTLGVLTIVTTFFSVAASYFFNKISGKV